MSRQFRSLLFKSARIQKEINAEHERRAGNWIRLLRLKLLRLKLMNRMKRLAAAGMRMTPGGGATGKRTAIVSTICSPKIEGRRIRNCHV